MQAPRSKQPSCNETVHPLPSQAMTLAGSPYRRGPVPADLSARGTKSPIVAGHWVVGEMSPHHGHRLLTGTGDADGARADP